VDAARLEGLFAGFGEEEASGTDTDERKTEEKGTISVEILTNCEGGVKIIRDSTLETGNSTHLGTRGTPLGKGGEGGGEGKQPLERIQGTQESGQALHT